MNYKLEFTNSALKHAKKIDHSDMSYIKSKIEILKTEPHKGKKLKGELDHFFSLRIRKYRVIYTIDDNKLIIVIINIGHRKEVYK